MSSHTAMVEFARRYSDACDAAGVQVLPTGQRDRLIGDAARGLCQEKVWGDGPAAEYKACCHILDAANLAMSALGVPDEEYQMYASASGALVAVLNLGC